MTPLLVVKLGGSLLDWPDWPGCLTRYLASRPDVRPVLVIGGGRFADVLRDLDHLHGLGEARSHALALQILDTTAHLAAALLPGSVVVTDLAEIRATHELGQVPIFAPRSFLDRQDQEAADPLPHAWSTTTDSIAARLAREVRAELVLLKSCPLPADCPDWTTAARLGLVDLEFPRAVVGVAKVSILCFRS